MIKIQILEKEEVEIKLDNDREARIFGWFDNVSYNPGCNYCTGAEELCNYRET